MRVLLTIVALLGLFHHYSVHIHSHLLQVITLTRHGDRAPDVAITQSCTKIFQSPGDVYKKFRAFPGLLTQRGIQRMRDVGSYIRQRYISGDYVEEKYLSNRGFMEPDYDTLQWEFMSREGNRQQMSMSAVALGIFPNVPVPTIVTRKYNDNILGGPPPECGAKTSEMIIKWHQTAGRDIVDSKPVRFNVLDPVEKVCNVSLAGNPVNAIQGGANPHCWIGDISDTADTWYSSAIKDDPFSTELRSKLTDLAFELEQGSHFDNPAAAIWFTGGFPLRIISSFEQFAADPEFKQPKKSPKMRMHLCSRELFYGLIHMFDLDVQAPGQPHNRVLAGSTFIWELHVEEDIFHPGQKGLVVKSYYWQPGMEMARPMMATVSLNKFRSIYEDYLKKNNGPWYEQCDLAHYNDVTNEHNLESINPDYTAIKSYHEKYIENFNKKEQLPPVQQQEQPQTPTKPQTPEEKKAVEEKKNKAGEEKKKQLEKEEQENKKKFEKKKGKSVDLSGAYANFLQSPYGLDQEVVDAIASNKNQVSNAQTSEEHADAVIEAQETALANQSGGSFGHFFGVASASIIVSAVLFYKRDTIRGMMQSHQYEQIP